MTDAKEWENRLPLAIVPTTYYSTPTDTFRKANISLIIWANHMIRSSTKEMIKNSRKIYKSESVISVEEKISTVEKIFNLQGVDELNEAKEKFRAKQYLKYYRYWRFTSHEQFWNEYNIEKIRRRCKGEIV